VRAGKQAKQTAVELGIHPVTLSNWIRQDEAELRAKRKRLKAFATALEDARRANDVVHLAAAELIDAGDMSRADLVRVFELTTSERGLVAARKITPTAGAATVADEGEATQSEDAYAAA
jgi:transposase-like protein